ncbi:MAG: head-tail connector protein [Lachnospiraceae bacterium]|nr:head-tail connector protein [Lachnospiraceae bacterium]
MKLSEISTESVIKYLRIDAGEEIFVGTLISASKQYIISYTGQTLEALDSYEDLTIVLYVLCAEMYDNRQLTVQNDKMNPIVQQILSSHTNSSI